MYIADKNRYSNMKYNRCGISGIVLPALSLGFWQNLGGLSPYENSRKMVLGAFDMGINHFDLANNYGPPAGSAEEVFGKILKQDLMPYRDELIISTKAGWWMWDGPYGIGSSKKYLVASLDQSLKRMGLDYVDIFYSHRFDPDTPLEETMDALAHIVHSGKALYVGISSYDAQKTLKAYELLQERGVRLFIHQPSYSMLDRWVEDGLLDVLKEKGVGSIAFSPLAQGLLTDKYLNGVPENSRAYKDSWVRNKITPELVEKLNKLNDLAKERGQTLAQMALAWVLSEGKMTSVIMGASRLEQIEENVKTLANLEFSREELNAIDQILK